MSNFHNSISSKLSQQWRVMILAFLLLAIPHSFCKEEKPKETFEYENYGVKYASPCEACKIAAAELEAKLAETGKNSETLQTSYHIDAPKNAPKKEKDYRKSHVRLIESMESACDGVLFYNVHKERKDSTRFDKGMSQTFQTLHGLVAKGVKVDLGMPYELWDKPSAEITDLKMKCENILEKYDSEIEDWYFKKQEEIPLNEYLCKDVVLKGKDYQCLYEEPSDEPETEEKAKKVKGEL